MLPSSPRGPVALGRAPFDPGEKAAPGRSARHQLARFVRSRGPRRRPASNERTMPTPFSCWGKPSYSPSFGEREARRAGSTRPRPRRPGGRGRALKRCLPLVHRRRRSPSPPRVCAAASPPPWRTGSPRAAPRRRSRARGSGRGCRRGSRAAPRRRSRPGRRRPGRGPRCRGRAGCAATAGSSRRGGCAACGSARPGSVAWIET